MSSCIASMSEVMRATILPVFSRSKKSSDSDIRWLNRRLRSVAQERLADARDEQDREPAEEDGRRTPCSRYSTTARFSARRVVVARCPWSMPYRTSAGPASSVPTCAISTTTMPAIATAYGRSMRDQAAHHPFGVVARQRLLGNGVRPATAAPHDVTSRQLGRHVLVVAFVVARAVLRLRRARALRGSSAFVASSPSCVPSATTRPSSSSTTRSASAIVAGRWAMMIVVRPCITSRKRAADLVLLARVDRRRRVVEDQDARVGEHRARDRDALPLTTRERVAVLADDRVVARRAGRARTRRRPRAGPRARPASIVAFGIGERDVAAHRVGEQERVLEHEADRAPDLVAGASRARRRRRCGSGRAVDVVEAGDRAGRRSSSPTPSRRPGRWPRRRGSRGRGRRARGAPGRSRT